MPGEVQFVQRGCREMSRIDADVAQHRLKVLAMEQVEAGEGSPPAADLFHGRTVASAPGIGELCGIDGG